MEDEGNEKQMTSSLRKEKIFNVKKLAYKQFSYQKYSKLQFDPPTENYAESVSPTFIKRGEYHFQIAIISSEPYKQLTKHYNQLKQKHKLQKEKRLAVLNEKQEELLKYQSQRQRLENQRYRLLAKRDQIRSNINELRERNQIFREDQQDSEEEIFNMDYLKQMIISMRYQNGVNIDPDQMTYEQLLQLGEQIGNVSKGFSLELIQQLPKIQVVGGGEGELCSICYEDVRVGEQLNKLNCQHTFHCQCIKEWLLKQRVCPMCKQEIIVNPTQPSTSCTQDQ